MLKKLILPVLTCRVFCIICLMMIACKAIQAQTPADLLSERMKTAEEFIQQQMQAGEIPGLSVLVIRKDSVVLKTSYGFADLRTQQKVNELTCFEIGSNTKAFTALGIMYLVKQGKVRLEDPVTKYIPWFRMQFNSRETGLCTPEIKVAELLHHTSGIPFHSIDLIRPENGPAVLEATVRRLVHIQLNRYPGDRFEYATINYDVLGLLIEKVSGQTYTAFMQQHVLEPLGLQHTFLSREQAGVNLATGYKLSFLQRQAYNAPFYTGNLPAGYIIANINDMEKWLRCQLGEAPDNNYRELIAATHVPDRSVLPDSKGGSYASGWLIYQNRENTIAHGGSNPNYSSFITFNPRDKTGVVVLSNLNTAYTEAIADGVLNILEGKPVRKHEQDMYKRLDIGVVVVGAISCLFILSTCWFMVVLLMEWKQGKRKLLPAIETKHVTSFLLSAAIVALIGFCMLIIPKAMFDGLSWQFMEVWAPASFLPCMLLLFAGISFFFVYYLGASVLKKEDDRSLYTVVTLSSIAGFGNALVIFTVNGAIGREHIFSSGYFYFFLLGLMLYVYCQGQLRTKLLHVVNSFVYTIRVRLVNNLLNTPFDKMEQLKHENLITVLSGDTQEVSNLPQVLVSIITGLVTLACCFAYLGLVNIWGLAISIVTIVAAASLYFYVTKKAGTVWEKTRDMQNIYISFINSLVKGFKELKLNNKRNLEFEEDMRQNSRNYRDTNIAAGRMFVNVFVVGELIFTIVIGAVVFVFPLVLIGLQEYEIRTFVFIFLYMTGPVNIVLNAFPNLTRIKIAWRRINQLEEKVATLVQSDNRQSLIVENGTMQTLELIDVEYKYSEESGKFSIGPVNCSFNSGEVVFITGGNGSGKSTLAKLICGLYAPVAGEIRLDGQVVDALHLNEMCAAIYSDYHIFEKLYGIDHHLKRETITDRMEVLQLEGKTAINNDGTFSTIRLSTGQRKRIALLVSYLENKPIYMFDEWAADQDPEFKSFFYEELLPELKLQGKCVIVISHDNHYFHVATRMIRMESGRLKVTNVLSV